MPITQETLNFIASHADDDANRIALRGGFPPGVDAAFAIEQIAGRQAARRKLPSWAAVEGLIFPPRLALEQCSGEAAAQYKAGVARRLLPQGGRMADLTGGLGADFAAIAPAFEGCLYVERQPSLCDIARHNMPLLGLARAEIVNGEAEDCLETMPPADLIFIDPSRRDASDRRVFAIEDCAPNVVSLREKLLAKCRFAMIKLSPMLDWRAAATALGPTVGEVHIVSTGGECKELLLVASRLFNGLCQLYCASDGEVVSFRGYELTNTGIGSGLSTPLSQTTGASLPSATVGFSPETYTLFAHNQASSPPQPNASTQNSSTINGKATTLDHLFVPNPSLMKAGCFAQIEARYGVRQIAPNSHLFVAPEPSSGFPGRAFRILRATGMGKRSLKQALAGVERANVATRNFPLSAEELRRKLRLSDGGDTFIFATTTAAGDHVLLVCTRLTP